MYEKIDAYIQRLVEESSPDRTIWNIEKLREGKPGTWNYIDGCMMTALLSMAQITGQRQYFDFVEGFIDAYILDDGTILMVTSSMLCTFLLMVEGVFTVMLRLIPSASLTIALIVGVT